MTDAVILGIGIAVFIIGLLEGQARQVRIFHGIVQ